MVEELIAVAVGSVLTGGSGYALARLAAREREKEARQQRSERDQARREDFLLKALDHFGGKTQERSVGIAIAEAYWKQGRGEQGRDHVDVLVPLLLNQLVYLLAVVDTVASADRAHERLNVKRIADLLDAIGEMERFGDPYRFALAVIEKKRDGHGLDLSSDKDIEASVLAFLSQAQRAVGASDP